MEKINFRNIKVISRIEKALGFKLYPWQQVYLFTDDMKISPNYRKCGNSTIYAVKELLTLEIKLNLFWKPSDIDFLIDHGGYNIEVRKVMKPFILDIDRKLKSAGFETCLKGTKLSNETVNLSRAMELAGTSTEDINKESILEIKLKKLDSVPIVYYKGEEIFGGRLTSILYNFETETDDSIGKQTIEINGYDIDGFQANKHPSLDTIKHERDAGV